MTKKTISEFAMFPSADAITPKRDTELAILVVAAMHSLGMRDDEKLTHTYQEDKEAVPQQGWAVKEAEFKMNIYKDGKRIAWLYQECWGDRYKMELRNFVTKKTVYADNHIPHWHEQKTN